MGKVNMNGGKTDIVGTAKPNAIGNMKTDIKPDTAVDTVDTLVIEPQAEETAKKPHDEAPKEANKTATKRHSVVYLAGGIWTDATGTCWCRDHKGNCISSKTFTEEEYMKRTDIQYMVSYGAMKDIVSE